MEKRSVIIALVILTLLAVGGSASGIYYYNKYQAMVERAKDPQAEVKEVLAKVGKLIELPKGEEPTVATVQDAEQIKSQPFFSKAQNGYRVILYTNARLAILFDEQANKLINVGAINVGTPSAVPEPTPGQ
jgi:predicted S18 family serine protease